MLLWCHHGGFPASVQSTADLGFRVGVCLGLVRSTLAVQRIEAVILLLMESDKVVRAKGSDRDENAE